MDILWEFYRTLFRTLAVYLPDDCSLCTPRNFYNLIHGLFQEALGQAIFCRVVTHPVTLPTPFSCGVPAEAISPAENFFLPRLTCAAITPEGYTCTVRAHPPYSLCRFHLSEWYDREDVY